MSNSVHILPMHPDHIPSIAALEKICFSRPWSERMLAEELENQCAAFLTAVDDAKAAGRRQKSDLCGEHGDHPLCAQRRERGGA